MEKSTKILIFSICLVIFLSGAVVGFYFLFQHLEEVDNIYTDLDKNTAQTEGEKEGEKYRALLEKMLKELEDRINNGSQVDFSEIETRYEAMLEDIRKQLESQEGSIGELSQSKIDSLMSMRGSLTDLQSMYDEELQSLNAQLAEVNEAIEELQNSEGDHADELAGFEFTRNFLQSQITSYTGVIQSLDSRIAEIDKTLAEINKRGSNL